MNLEELAKWLSGNGRHNPNLHAYEPWLLAAAAACRECIVKRDDPGICHHGLRIEKCPLCPDPVGEAEHETDRLLAEIKQ